MAILVVYAEIHIIILLR